MRINRKILLASLVLGSSITLTVSTLCWFTVQNKANSGVNDIILDNPSSLKLRYFKDNYVTRSGTKVNLGYRYSLRSDNSITPDGFSYDETYFPYAEDYKLDISLISPGYAFTYVLEVGGCKSGGYLSLDITGFNSTSYGTYNSNNVYLSKALNVYGAYTSTVADLTTLSKGFIQNSGTYTDCFTETGASKDTSVNILTTSTLTSTDNVYMFFTILFSNETDTFYDDTSNIYEDLDISLDAIKVSELYA